MRTNKISRRRLGQIVAGAAIANGFAPAISRTAKGQTQVRGGTIRYWDFIDPKQPNPRGEALGQMLANFAKRYPQIEVKVEVLPWNQIETQIIQAAAAGKTPDVVRMQLPTYGQVVAANALMPLNQFTEPLGKSFRDDFLINWDATEWEGKKMAIPWDHRAGVLYYRQDILTSFGLGVPKTLDELVNAGQVLAKNNLGGFMVGLSRNEQAFACIEWAIPMLWSAGGELLHPDGKAAFNSSAGVRLLEFIADLINNKKAMPASALTTPYEGVFQGVKAGTVALNSMGTHRVVSARAAGNLGDKLKTAPLPGFQSDRPAPPHLIGWVLGIGKDTKNPEAAWALIEHLVNTESLLIFAKVAGELPARKSVYDDNWITSPEGAEMMMWRDYFSKYGRAQKYRDSPVELWQSLADAIGEVVQRGRPAQQALNDAAAKFDALLVR